MRRTWAAAGLMGLGVLVLGGIVMLILSPPASQAIMVSTLPLDGQAVAVAVDQRSGHAFVATSAADRGRVGLVYVLNDATGAMLHTVTVGPSPVALALDTHVGYLYVVDKDDGTARALDTRTGAVRRTVVLFSGTVPMAAAVDERAGRTFVAGYVPGSGGTVSVIETTSGALLRIMPLGLTPWNTAVDGTVAEAFAISPVSNAIAEFDTRTGVLRRTLAIGGGHGALALDAHIGHLFVTNALTATVSMLDVGSGSLLRTVSVGRNPVALAVDERTARVFVIARGPVDGTGAALGSGTISELDATSGRVVGTATVGWNPSAVAVDSTSGDVFVANAGVIDSMGNYDGVGSVTKIDEHSRASLRSIDVGVAPQYLALDERAGRLLVVNEGGAVTRREAWVWMPSWLRRWLPQSGRLPPRAPSSVTILDTAR